MQKIVEQVNKFIDEKELAILGFYEPFAVASSFLLGN